MPHLVIDGNASMTAAVEWHNMSTPAQGKAFVAERPVRFSDCDPSGIMFYPCCLIMLNSVVEDWWAHLGKPWKSLIMERRMGTPTTHLDTIFSAPSAFGDTVAFHLHVESIGKSSLVLHHIITGPDQKHRWRARQRLVATSLDTHRSIPWPDDIRAAINLFLEES